MKFPANKSIWTAAAVAAIASLLSTPIARADSITLTASGTGGDGPIDAMATITTGAGTLDIVLTSLQTGSTAAGQEISGVFVTLSSAPGSPTFASGSPSGTLIDIAKGTGTVTPDGSPINHWGTSATGDVVCLETAGTCAVGGQPVDMIIGPANGSGAYPGANGSLVSHSPHIQGTGTFDLLLSGVTADTFITDVKFEFGTGPDSFIDCTVDAKGGSTCAPAVVTPEPSSLLLLGSGLLGAAGLVGRRLFNRG